MNVYFYNAAKLKIMIVKNKKNKYKNINKVNCGHPYFNDCYYYW